jgi:hypothetical protein
MKKRRHVKDIASQLANTYWVRWWCVLGYPHTTDECIQIRNGHGALVELDGIGESEMMDEGFTFCLRHRIYGYHRKGDA